MLTLQTPDVLLQYDEKSGSVQTLNCRGKSYSGAKTGIFRLALRDSAGEQTCWSVEDMPLTCCERDENGFRAVYENSAAAVTVSASLAGEELRWRAAAEVKNGGALEWIDFPRIAVPNDLKDSGGAGRILWGFNEGVLVDDLSFKESPNGYGKFEEPGYPTHPTAHLYPAIVQTQFLAYLIETEGLYLGAHDPEHNLKGIDFYPEGGGILLHLRNYCGCGYGQAYKQSYDTVLTFFRGDWHDAAQIYRIWFESCGKRDFVLIEENPGLPDWYGQSPVVVTYPVRGTYDTSPMEPNKLFPYCNAMEHIRRLEEELGSRLLVLLMHWEGTAPWAPPYVWPPYGGEEELKKFTDALHERGDLLGLYCSGIGWTQYSKLVDGYSREDEFREKQLEKVMCRSPKQELPYSAVVPFIRAGFDMCPLQPFTTEVMRREVRHMVDAGADYIQLLDQQHGGTSYFCYSKDHGHPPVPGKWQVDAMKDLMKAVKQDAGKVLLGTESAAAESYIPYLPFSDNRFEINYSVGKPVPLYAYLFHEYVNNFMGNQVWTQGHINFEKDPGNVLERLAYSFTAGDMLTVVLNQDGAINWCWDCDQYVHTLPEQESIKALIRNLNGWRQGKGKKYLHTGKMVKPLPVDCPCHVVHCVVDDHETEIDGIHTSAWLAADGSFGQFLVNYHTEEKTCTVTLPEGKFRLCTEKESRGDLSAGAHEIAVPALSALLLEKR